MWDWLGSNWPAIAGVASLAIFVLGFALLSRIRHYGLSAWCRRSFAVRYSIRTCPFLVPKEHDNQKLIALIAQTDAILKKDLESPSSPSSATDRKP